MMINRYKNCVASSAFLAALALGLTGCGKQTSAVAPADQVATAGAPAAYGSGNAPPSAAYGGGYGSNDPRAAPVPQVNGKPMWAANRKHTAQENAQYQFTKNGRDFGASNETDYVAKAHAFIDHPPGDIETLDRRNGDKLLYDPKANVFAVVSREGAPRTMFKPRGGPSYWDQQKVSVSQGPAANGASDQSQG